MKYKYLILFGFFAVGSCSSGPVAPHRSTMPKLPDAETTRATLAGPLCEDVECQCTDVPTEIGKATTGKRYAWLISSPHEAWLSIDDMVLYKSSQRAKACYYTDMNPGSHAISLRSRNAVEGLDVSFAVREIGGGEKDTFTYGTFDLACTGCLDDDIRDILAPFKAKKGKGDPCGSTKVQSIDWMTERVPDSTVLNDLLLNFKLKVYNFATKYEPGDPQCADKQPDFDRL